MAGGYQHGWLYAVSLPDKLPAGRGGGGGGEAAAPADVDDPASGSTAASVISSLSS
jgi:hypothetical protein